MVMRHLKLFAALWVLVCAAPALAQGIADHDASLPIDIEADRLEVQQANESAIFFGNVDVQQGNLDLKSDQLEVFYALEGNGASAQAVKRIVAKGNVFITSPEETAQGDEGVYSLTDETLVLTGNVVLTRGDNVIRGGRLDIDLAASVATMRAAENQSNGRVRALFVPAAGQ